MDTLLPVLNNFWTRMLHVVQLGDFTLHNIYTTIARALLVIRQSPAATPRPRISRMVQIFGGRGNMEKAYRYQKIAFQDTHYRHVHLRRQLYPPRKSPYSPWFRSKDFRILLRYFQLDIHLRAHIAVSKTWCLKFALAIQLLHHLIRIDRETLMMRNILK